MLDNGVAIEEDGLEISLQKFVVRYSAVSPEEPWRSALPKTLSSPCRERRRDLKLAIGVVKCYVLVESICVLMEKHNCQSSLVGRICFQHSLMRIISTSLTIQYH